MPLIRHDLMPFCRDPINLLALGFGSGLARRAPGTFGTLAGIPFLPLFGLMTLPWASSLLLVAVLAGVLICGHASRSMGLEDPGCVVWDEMVGLWVTLYALPLTFSAVVGGFLLFRLFDILKPWPISWCDRTVKGGLGIMVDDLLAGLFAGLLLRVLLWVTGQVPQILFLG
ncbi:MAG: phosphatidylglycerophosphatase A [Gammaproteobacteria bacterium]|nr:MAG: phosphatidylglycerophosphatase A [Gammaproteobacteria bacterium]RLA12386.1 MAG: phosphatidylglycerophosphatase A [Gammaproteobacteria bacterium]RLA14923.1 MAG: phosphatidylglycerophosphatase A [Gammaproteobacteria bacterium]